MMVKLRVIFGNLRLKLYSPASTAQENYLNLRRPGISVDTNWTLVPLSVSTVHHFVELSCYGARQWAGGAIMKGIFYLFPMPGVELTRCTIVAGRPRQVARHKLALE